MTVVIISAVNEHRASVNHHQFGGVTGSALIEGSSIHCNNILLRQNFIHNNITC